MEQLTKKVMIAVIGLAQATGFAKAEESGKPSSEPVAKQADPTPLSATSFSFFDSSQRSSFRQSSERDTYTPTAPALRQEQREQSVVPRERRGAELLKQTMEQSEGLLLKSSATQPDSPFSPHARYVYAPPKEVFRPKTIAGNPFFPETDKQQLAKKQAHEPSGIEPEATDKLEVEKIILSRTEESPQEPEQLSKAPIVLIPTPKPASQNVSQESKLASYQEDLLLTGLQQEFPELFSPQPSVPYLTHSPSPEEYEALAKNGRVEQCERPADIVGLKQAGTVIPALRHRWIRVPGFEAGLGPEGGGVPGEEFRSEDSLPYFTKTEITSHNGQGDLLGSQCSPVENIDENCIREQLSIGQERGSWKFLWNDCHTLVDEVLEQCQAKETDKE